jgi:Lar family restriction alleviation protein
MNKPCPFCGSDELDYRICTEDREGIPTSIMCMDCGSIGPSIYLKKSELERELPARALELWNNRKES